MPPFTPVTLPSLSMMRQPPNGHYDRIVHLTTALQGQTHRWLDDAAARWHAERRESGGAEPSLPVS